MLGVDFLEVVDEVPQQAGALGHVVGGLVEKREEAVVAGDQPESHRDTPLPSWSGIHRTYGPGQGREEVAAGPNAGGERPLSTLGVTWT